MPNKCAYCWDWNSAAFGYGNCPVCDSIYTNWEFDSLERRIDRLEIENLKLKERLNALKNGIEIMDKPEH